MNEHDMDQLADMIGTDREGAFARVIKGVPQGRVADPGEIVGVCTFLASDDASFRAPIQIIKERTQQIELKVILLPLYFSKNSL